ncbi:TPA: GDSL family lipase, partial [Klebsiella pneumoniae]|nr:GDSL family lipase [Klebsiella pneumoniae]HBZ4107092.1 GDSL family lipase [Klebsiella pneumoniae]
MAFNPELGSTSPAVLLDNAERLDKLVNGPELTEPDRAGVELDTWRGMMAKSTAAIDDAQNSITILGLPFATLADAQAAVDAGKIPDGAVTWIRNDDASLADEYINNGGTLSATGRKMPSQEYIDDGFTPGRVVESDT